MLSCKEGSLFELVQDRNNNKNIVESRVLPSDTLITYKVLLGKTTPDPLKPWTIFPPYSAGVEVEPDNEGNLLLYYGHFTRLKEAEKSLANAKKSSDLKGAMVVRFVNGRRQN